MFSTVVESVKTMAQCKRAPHPRCGEVVHQDGAKDKIEQLKGSEDGLWTCESNPQNLQTPRGATYIVLVFRMLQKRKGDHGKVVYFSEVNLQGLYFMI